MIAITVRQSTSNNIRFSLLSDDVAIDLTNAERVVLMMKANDGVTTTHDSDVATSGCVIADAAQGLVDFYPYDSVTYTTSINLLASKSPYKAYIWVYPNISPSLIKYSVPESTEVTINVRSE